MLHATIRRDFVAWPVREENLLKDGTVLVLDPARAPDPLTAPRAVLVGTRPRTQRERARDEALEIVHEGMADVLEWIGETPFRWRPGKAVLADLRDIAEPA